MNAWKGISRPAGITKTNPVGNAEGTWNAAIAIYMGSSDYANLARPGAYRAIIELLQDAMGPLKMRDAKPYMIEELVDKRKKEGKITNDLVTLIRRACTIGISRGWLNVDLTAGLKKQKQKNLDGFRPWTDDEVAQWRAFYPDHASMPRRAFELLYATGLRGRSDATRVEWKDIKRASDGRLWLWGFVPQKTKKHGKKVTAPLIDGDLLQCLAHCPQEQGPLLRNASGDAYTPDHFSYDWRRWAKAAGMASDFTPHGARKMIATDAIEFGVSVEDGMHVTAHTPEQFRHYAKAAKAAISADRAMEQIVSGRRRKRANLQTSSIGLQDTVKNMNENNVAA